MKSKSPLPSKPCAACGRPFNWRRKWARDWDNVRYCSDACRTGTRATAIAARSGSTRIPPRAA